MVWEEARKWAGSRTSRQKYRMPKSQRSDGTIAGSTKRRASRAYQLKSGHVRHRIVPALGQGPALCAVLVVPEPHADEGPPLQGVFEVFFFV